MAHMIVHIMIIHVLLFSADICSVTSRYVGHNDKLGFFFVSEGVHETSGFLIVAVQ